MSFSENVIDKAVSMSKKLVLPEGTEHRTVQAARIILDRKIASRVFLVGDREEIEAVADSEDVRLEGIEIINPVDSGYLNSFRDEFFELRKHKGISIEEAEKAIKEPLYWGSK